MPDMVLCSVPTHLYLLYYQGMSGEQRSVSQLWIQRLEHLANNALDEYLLNKWMGLDVVFIRSKWVWEINKKLTLKKTNSDYPIFFVYLMHACIHILVHVHMCECGCMCAIVHMWRSENNLWSWSLLSVLFEIGLADQLVDEFHGFSSLFPILL